MADSASRPRSRARPAQHETERSAVDRRRRRRFPDVPMRRVRANGFLPCLDVLVEAAERYSVKILGDLDEPLKHPDAMAAPNTFGMRGDGEDPARLGFPCVAKLL